MLLMYIRIALALLGLSMTAACVNDTQPSQVSSLTETSLMKPAAGAPVAKTTPGTTTVASTTTLAPITWSANNELSDESRYVHCQTAPYTYTFTLSASHNWLSFTNDGGGKGEGAVGQDGSVAIEFQSVMGLGKLTLRGNVNTRELEVKNGSCVWHARPTVHTHRS